ncbi:401_t:CDS:2, partial [Entrophospora sp. SA101]
CCGGDIDDDYESIDHRDASYYDDHESTYYRDASYVLLPYENYKPGSWFEDGEDISLFLLLDHYDELQLPEGGGDPVTYNQFIVYMMDPPTLAGGCNAWSALSSKDPKRDRRLNDCLYQCLYYTYGTFSNLPRTIEKPDILKQILGLERCNPIPVHLIEKVEKLAKSIAINIVGDAT